MRGAFTLAMAVAATGALPACADAATAQTSVYRVVQAKGTQRVTFSADSSTCGRFGTCGSSGTVTYKFGGTARGRLVMKRDRRGHVTGAANFSSHGTTTSDVTAVPRCTDTVRHRREHFSMTSKSRHGKLVFGLHGAEVDYLATDCPGPTDADLEHGDALPAGPFKRDGFDAVNTAFALKGSHSFRESGYVGTTRWKVAYKLRRIR